MGLIEKEKKWFNSGLEAAHQLVSLGGIELLEQEIAMRKVNGAPAGVPSIEIKNAAREYSKKELRLVATSLAYVISYDMGLPPSVTMDFLHKFNSKCDELRMSDEAIQKAEERLQRDSGFNAWLEKFNNNMA